MRLPIACVVVIIVVVRCLRHHYRAIYVPNLIRLLTTKPWSLHPAALAGDSCVEPTLD